MDVGQLTFFLKRLQEEYALNSVELETLKNRLLADNIEFERVYRLFQTQARGSLGGKDPFAVVLRDLLNT